MPVDRLIRFGFPHEGESGVFGGNEGKLWRLVSEVVELVEAVVEDEMSTATEDLSAAQALFLRDRLIAALDKKIARDYGETHSVKNTYLTDVIGDLAHSSASPALSEPTDDSNENPPLLDKTSSSHILTEGGEQLKETEEDLSFEHKIRAIAIDSPWNEAISQISVCMLQHASKRARVKTFQFADATKALILVSRFAGFKFLNPNIGDISHLFFNGLLEKKLVKQTEWMFKFPAKPFSSMAANHPEELHRKGFNRPGSTRELTAYGLTRLGFENYRKDLMKLGLLKSEVDLVCEVVEENLRAPWDEIEELAIDPDSISPEK